ncbi:ABC transporter ATP-binding protein [Pseudorhodoplanes sinuspersici]|uniref:Nitrate/sulfonate/bicarbonate ABC transporter ATP-binding protein n=1 Tax=Pseudorhodoplanes sinuspersici TaxID=1235591 RepID=A0A1W6ZZT6_9HYPH|nr:ABC transporter ATP-binding protein [Pseudorhodoplanes sinuspersici]ARQ02641.1 nitrate/sulfonate/bicarbonate ABC transporter ATP-binding protein [Pseudorhodoplanes sinuspersici]RKE74513.1 NitT/TauT family transport system ATP-binding protein [Pseudorhodoplanes sinuspersici]
MTLQGALAGGDLAHTKQQTITGDVPVISLKDVTKVFTDNQGRTIEALAPLDLVIESGTFVSVVGPSGCGKSTLLRLIAGLDAPTSGTMFRYGAPLDSPSHEVGIIFQEHVLFPWLTVLQNVMLPADILSLPKSGAEKRAWHLLELTDLKDFAHHKPQALSGGMKQRAAFCRAMLANPRFLLLDEPFGALDALTREELSLELSRLWDEVGRTAFLITHDIEEAILLGDRILVMSQRPGRIVADIPVKLPRPRTMRTSQDPLFQDIKQKVRQIIFGRQEDAS